MSPKAFLVAAFASFIAWLTPAQAATYTVDVIRGSTVVLISGTFEFDEADRFREWARTKRIKRPSLFMFNSHGGNPFGAIMLGHIIRETGAGTAVAPGDVCASACAFAWSAGKRRYTADGAMIGFHSVYTFANKAPVETDDSRAHTLEVARVLKEWDVADSVIVQMIMSRGSASETYWLTPGDFRAMDVTTVR